MFYKELRRAGRLWQRQTCVGSRNMRSKLGVHLTVAACLLGVLVACGPRGESKSLDELLGAAKQRFSRADAQQLDEAVGKQVQRLQAQLAILEQQDKFGPGPFLIIAQELSALEEHAGYTSRPSISELTDQFRLLGSEVGQADSAKVKLMLSRAYNLLASELETTRFSVR